MIDTIILSIPERAFTILDYARFRTTPEEIAKVSGFKKFPNNPTREEWERGYYPRLTLEIRSFTKELKVEFSAPKLIFNGDNTNEVEEKDFENIISVLHQRLKEMGVLVYNKDSLIFCDVTDFHACKNVILLGGYRANYVIRELEKIDLHGKLDLTRTKYKNGGHSLYCYAETYEVVFYDKYAEAFLPKKRRIDSEAKYQADLFSGPLPEILRIEVRLLHKNKINSVLKDLGFPHNPLFKDVFKKELCQKVIQYFWHKIVTDKNEFLFHPVQEPQRLYSLIRQNHPTIPHHKAVQFVGLSALSRDRGIRELKTLIEKNGSNKTWTRTKKDFDRLDRIMPSDGGVGFVREIEKALGEFETYRLPKVLKRSNEG